MTYAIAVDKSDIFPKPLTQLNRRILIAEPSNLLNSKIKLVDRLQVNKDVLYIVPHVTIVNQNNEIYCIIKDDGKWSIGLGSFISTVPVNDATLKDVIVNEVIKQLEDSFSLKDISILRDDISVRLENNNFDILYSQESIYESDRLAISMIIKIDDSIINADVRENTWMSVDELEVAIHDNEVIKLDTWSEMVLDIIKQATD